MTTYLDSLIDIMKRACPPGMHSHPPDWSKSSVTCHPPQRAHSKKLVSAGAHKPMGASGKEEPPKKGPVEDGKELRPPAGRVWGKIEAMRPEKGQTEHLGIKIPKESGNKKVFLNPDPDNNGGSAMVMVDQDTGKQTNYIRTPKQIAEADAKKWARLGSFDKDFSENESTIVDDMQKGTEEAAVIMLMKATGFRVGRPGSKTTKRGAPVDDDMPMDDEDDEMEAGEDSGELATYGSTTMLNKHVRIGRSKEDGSPVSLVFNFPSKGGVQIPDKYVKDPELAKVVDGLRDRKEPDKPIFNVDHQQVRNYLKKVVGKGYKAHDMRTMVANHKAIEIMASKPEPTNEEEYNALWNDVAKGVSDFLVNTPNVAMENYVNPAIFVPIRSRLGLNEEQTAPPKSKRKPKDEGATTETQAPVAAQRRQRQAPVQQQPSQQPAAVQPQQTGITPAKPTAGKLSREQKQEIVRLWDTKNIPEIAEAMKIPQEQVKRTLQRLLPG